MGTERSKLAKQPSGSLTGLGIWLDEECKGEGGTEVKCGQGLDGVTG